jgi:twitching motility protein PilU
MDLTPYLKLISEKNAQSLAFKIDSTIIVSLGGQTKPVGKTVMDAKLIKEIAFGFLDELKKKELIQNKTITFNYTNTEQFIFSITIHVETEGLSLLIQPGLKADDVSPDELKDKKTETVAPVTPIVPVAPPDTSSTDIQVLGVAPEGDLDILPYLRKMVQIEASDLFLTVGSSVKTKLSGRAIELDKFVLTPELTRSAVKSIMTKEQWEEFQATKDLDFAIAMPDGSARFRANAFYQRKTVGLVMRLIPSKIPNAKDMGLPEILLELIMVKRGLLLMVGGTGSGKSTTLAAMINHRNANSPGHILTIEDPVEFSHPNLMSIVNQREVGVDTASYAKALKASLREAPDVILIGEIRDEETMEAALELANTGHLCISTMHANNANQAMERIVNMFPQVRHKQLFMDIAGSLNGVVSQRLIPDVRGKRVAAIEVMINTPHIANLILKGQLHEIKDAMASSGSKGMKVFDSALFDLYKEGKITLEEALKNADSQNDMEAKINFG